MSFDQGVWSQIIKIRNERGDITSDAMEIKKIIQDNWTFICLKLDNLQEMDKFRKIYDLPRLNHEEI